MALKSGELPASPGFENADSDIGATPTRQTERMGATAAVSTSLGFGGGSAAVVLGGAPCS